jgi:hypothetical protein
MAKGLLTVDGFIRLDQFWPKGKSDGDTVKITIPKGVNDAFKFAKPASGPPKVVHTFDNALSFDAKVLPQKSIKFATKGHPTAWQSQRRCSANTDSDAGHRCPGASLQDL